MEELAAQGRVARIAWDGAAVWVATERRALFEPLPPSDESLVEIVRGRLEGLGPVTASALAGSLRLPASRINIALGKLEAEGFAMRGRFGASPCGGRLPGTRNGANAGCSRASTATRSNDCAPRSSRCRPAIFCGFSASGSGCCRRRACRGRMRWRPCSRSSRASRRRPARGRPRSSPRAWSSMSRNGWTSIAARGGSCGRGSPRAAPRTPPAPSAAMALRRFAPRPSPCWRDAACRSGRR